MVSDRIREYEFSLVKSGGILPIKEISPVPTIEKSSVIGTIKRAIAIRRQSCRIIENRDHVVVRVEI